MLVAAAAVIGLISGIILGIKVKSPLTEKPVIRVFFYCLILTIAGAAIGWIFAPFVLSFV